MPREKVLIIDDSEELRSLLEAILPFGGYEAHGVGSGEEGLSLVPEFEPDLILIDLELPDMTGLRVLEELNKLGYSIPTIMMTGYGSEGSAARALRLGVRDYLIKPFTTDEVLSSIERALSESRLRRGKEQQALLLSDYDRRFNLLSASGQMLAREPAGNQLLARLVEAARLATRAEVGLLLKRDEDQNGLRVVVAQGGPGPEVAATVVGPGDERLAPVLNEGAAIRLQAGADEPIEIQTGDRVKAVCQVPLIAQGRVWGLLTVDRRTREQAFTQVDEQTLTILASYAALVLK